MGKQKFIVEVEMPAAPVGQVADYIRNAIHADGGNYIPPDWRCGNWRRATKVKVYPEPGKVTSDLGELPPWSEAHSGAPLGTGAEELPLALFAIAEAIVRFSDHYGTTQAGRLRCGADMLRGLAQIIQRDLRE